MRAADPGRAVWMSRPPRPFHVVPQPLSDRRPLTPQPVHALRGPRTGNFGREWEKVSVAVALVASASRAVPACVVMDAACTPSVRPSVAGAFNLAAGASTRRLRVTHATGATTHRSTRRWALVWCHRGGGIQQPGSVGGGSVRVSTMRRSAAFQPWWWCANAVRRLANGCCVRRVTGCVPGSDL